jgi:hypothetical protein
MYTLDPSLLFAASVLLDLVYDTLHSKHTEDEAIGFWAEWLAWAILLVFYWTAPILHRHAAASAFRAGLEEAADPEKCPQPKYGAWVAPVLSVCLVGVGVLWQSQNEKYNWTLVSQRTWLCATCAYLTYGQPMTTMLVLLVLMVTRLDTDQGDFWHNSLNSLGWASTVSAPALFMLSMVSVGVIRFHSSPKSSWITPFDVFLLLSQCVVYSTLVRVKIEMLSKNCPTSRVQEHLLQRVSASSFALWTLLLIVSLAQNLRLRPTFFVMGIIRAFHYFAMFTLVDRPRVPRLSNLVD